MRFRPVLLMPMILFGCGSGNSSTGSTSQQSSRVDQITIAKMDFSVPASVSSSDQIELVNNDSVKHNLMFMDESFSIDVESGKTVALPQLQPGKYSFHCHIHPTMMGTLTVS
ncbi:MAG: cupredoxin domain-containing protein [Ilumatobacteraceae bacterium]